VAKWQTLWTQNPLSERACGFDSHLGHQSSALDSLHPVGRVTRRLIILAVVATAVAIWREHMLTSNERALATAKLPTGN
jgi:hypothetical protein